MDGSMLICKGGKVQRAFRASNETGRVPSRHSSANKPFAPRWVSFSGGSPDLVNNANLNVRLDIPVVHKAGRGALLSVVTMFNGYDDLPFRMSFFKITDSFSRLA